jgi:hypothetical protein
MSEAWPWERWSLAGVLWFLPRKASQRPNAGQRPALPGPLHNRDPDWRFPAMVTYSLAITTVASGGTVTTTEYG